MKPRRAFAGPAATSRARAWNWAWAGVLLGGLATLVVAAPASWLARGLDQATGGRLLIADARGTVWRGSGVLVLTGGPDSRDASSLPGRLVWRLQPGLGGVRVEAEQACCLNGTMRLLLRPGIGRWRAELLPSPGWIGQWPGALLGGLGTPWNTLQLGGLLRLQSTGLVAESVQGRLQLSGQAQLELQGLTSRVSTLASLGSYRLQIEATPASGPGTAQLSLTTLEGALRLQGNGQWSASGLRLRGDAQAATPADEAALGNLLNIIGRRQGARSVISIG